MSGVKIFDNKPVAVELEANKDYFWCACGRSSKQPFCDGSHRGTEFTPLKFSVDSADKKYMCLCKQSKNPPFCDGSHKAINSSQIEKPIATDAMPTATPTPEEPHVA